MQIPKTILITLVLLVVAEARSNIFVRPSTPVSKPSAVAGGWKKQDATTFAQSNNNVIQESVNAVNSKFNPQSQGYEFLKVVSVDSQLVNGLNYAVVLQYQSANFENQFYEVVIYSPLFNAPDQVVAVKQITQSTGIQQGGWQQVNANTFASSNSNVLQTGVNAVNTQYNPQQNGYTFTKVVTVVQQVVSGMNYNIVLEYSNATNQNAFYDVVIYSCPWEGIDQVVSVKQVQQ